MPENTAQKLASTVKSCRQIMRKDKGLSGELDRLPMLTWVMFLKFLDSTEKVREAEIGLSGKNYKPIIEEPYRWRDWGTTSNGITGDDLLNFINLEEAVLPDGSRGRGLFAYLRNLRGTQDDRRKDVVANVFRGINNRMIDGYLLRDMVNKIESLDFGSSEEIDTLGSFYESMLKEMRDAAGDSGEFYTPRPVVKMMVEMCNPKIGQTILDPACGTGGFLIEAFAYLKEQSNSVESMKKLQSESIFGGEAKPLPYLLCQMNMLLHGIENPDIVFDNSLKVPLREIGDRDRVDIIATNPPFGGEEEKGIQNNFPQDKQT